MKSRHARLAALALPLVVLAGMMLRAELILARGQEYEINITGYDPRDLLRGHYLRYRVEWNVSYGQSTCQGKQDDECCLCIPEDAETVNPRVNERSPHYTDGCKACIPPRELQNLEQYFIPEDMGMPLERAIRAKRASLRVSISRSGSVVIRDLLIEGRPWREVVVP